eukprot:7245353-Alexandrium_andersonii.AAC.1
MSASLVGSEMCIRDRGDPRCSAMTHPPSAAPCPRARPALSALSSPRWPVSYTHLTLPTICSV